MARQIKLVVSLAIAVMVTMAGLSIATGTAAAQGWQDEFDGVPDPDGSGVLVLDENRWTIEDKDRLGQPKFGTPGNIAGQHRGYYVRGNVELPQGTGTLRLRLFQEEDAVEGVISSGALIFTKEKYGYGTYTWSMRMSSTADVPYGDGSPKSGSVSAGFIYEINSVTEIDFEFSGHVLQDNDPSDDETLYPGFPFWPPGHQRSYIQPPPLEPFLWFFHPERLQRPRKGPTLLLRVRKSLEVPHFKQFPRHLSVPFPPSPGLVPLRRRTLSGWHRQTLNPPHHASKQAPRQMALGQHQPVVTGMLHQPPARLHEPLLQARQRPVVDPLR